MYEKVNPSHPDKIADRIAGAIVDLAYKKAENPRIAVEVLIGHGRCMIIAETSVFIDRNDVERAVERIAGEGIAVSFMLRSQDEHLAENQKRKIRCGDNGIFRGMPVTEEQKALTAFSRALYEVWPYDGKFIAAGNRLIACQSNADSKEIVEFAAKKTKWQRINVNPLGEWTGGTDVDTGATNRKLGSDMGDAVTGGGLHGKDLSKADVSVNIYAHQKAQAENRPVELYCAIGDEMIDGKPYEEIVRQAREYIKSVGGFEKFAEWGLI